MKFPSFPPIGRFIIQGATFGLSASILMILVSIVYASIPWGALPNTSTGSGLTATAWNDLVTHVNQSVKQTSEIITINGANVGIGNPSPTTKLDITGDVKISGTIRAKQPAFSAYATTSVTGPVTSIAYAGVTTNVGNYYNPTNGRFTAPITGTYFITARGLTDLSTLLQLRIYVNNVGIEGLTAYSSAITSGHTHQSISGVISLNAGDYVTIGITSGSMHGGPNYNSGFSGFLIGSM